MVSGLESAGLVVTEKLDMVFEQLRRQDENAARLELRLAEYSEAVAEARTEQPLARNKHPFLRIINWVHSR